MSSVSGLKGLRARGLRVLLLGGVAGAAAISAGAAWADAADAGSSVDEVVVTGQRLNSVAAAGTKTDTPLIETPQAITVMTRSVLDDLGAKDVNQAMRYVAGVTPETRGGTATRYDLLTIRGFQPPEYLDGMRLLGGYYYLSPQVDLSQLDRIEIVKGPASVLYGQAAPGGIVNLVSKRPTLDPHGEISVTGGNYDFLNGTVDVGGPIDKDGKFLYRVYGVAQRSDGFIESTENRHYAINGALTWRPDADTDWTVLAAYQDDPKAASYGSVPAEGSVLPNPYGKLGRSFYDGDPSFEQFKRTQASVSSFFERRLTPGWTFRQNARYLRVDGDYESVYASGLEADDHTLNRGTAASDETSHAFTLDNQLNGKFSTGPVQHNLLVGADYQYVQQRLLGAFGSAPTLDILDPDHHQTIPDPYSTGFVLHDHVRQRQTGVYAQDQLKLGALSVIASGRYDWYHQRLLDLQSDTDDRMKQHAFTGRVGAIYELPGGLAPYVSYSTSFEPQSGLVRSSETDPGSAAKPTKGKQVEAGVKYQPGVWDAFVTLAAFDLKQDNVLQSVGVITTEAGTVKSRGIELEANAKPLPGLKLMGSYTYLDNKNQDGIRPYGVAQALANFWGTYTVQSGPLEGLGLGGGVRYVGQSGDGASYQVTDGNNVVHVVEHGITIGAATLFDAVLQYDLSKASPKLANWRFAVNANNLFDKRYVSSCYNSGASATTAPGSADWCWFGPRRTVQATLSYKW